MVVGLNSIPDLFYCVFYRVLTIMGTSGGTQSHIKLLQLAGLLKEVSKATHRRKSQFFSKNWKKKNCQYLC